MSAKLYASRGSTNTYQTNIQAIIISMSETSTESTITISIIITITTGSIIITGLITIETIFQVYKFYVEVEITMEDQPITGQDKAQCPGGITDYNRINSPQVSRYVQRLFFFVWNCSQYMFSTLNFLIPTHIHTKETSCRQHMYTFS